MSTLRDRILQSADAGPTEVQVPEWGCSVWVRPLSGRERAAFVKLADGLDEAELTTRLVLLAACDGAGLRLFTEDDFDALHGKNWMVLERIGKAACRVNGLTPDAVAQAKNG